MTVSTRSDATAARSAGIAAAYIDAAAIQDRLADDRRAARLLGAVACVVLAVIAAMVVYVFKEGWPSFSHNGFGWFLGPGGGKTVDQQLTAIFDSPAGAPVYRIGAWPLLYATAITTIGSGALALCFATFASIFIAEFAPRSIVRVLEPVVRLLAAVPSVIYGLVALLVLVPWIDDHLISLHDKQKVQYVVQLSGNSMLAALVVLTVMITPIMIALITDALRSVPKSWIEGSIALGVNRWRTVLKVSLRAARPAMIAAVVLAGGRAVGEAIALSMVSGSVGFAPNPLDGHLFLLEPLRPLAATIVENAEGLSVKPFGQTMYAFASVLLVSTMALSLCAYAVKRSMRRYTTRG